MSAHSKFVSEAIETGGFIALWSANGQKSKYPVARVKIVLDGEEYNREVAVAADLPEDVLLGVDVPLVQHILPRLSKEETGKLHLMDLMELGQTYAVTTRTQAQRLAREQVTQQRDSTEEVKMYDGVKGCDAPMLEVKR